MAASERSDGDDDNRSISSSGDPPRKKFLRVAVFVLFVGILFGLVSQAPESVYEDTVEGFLKLKARVDILEGQLRQKLNESVSQAYLTEETNRPGYKLRKEGASAKYPLIMVPGFVTSGLEVWGGDDCAKKYFRARLWAAVGMVESVMTQRDCWKAHMSLDPLTGLDPDGIRIRAASGFEAADYFMANYWVGGLLPHLQSAKLLTCTLTLSRSTVDCILRQL